MTSRVLDWACRRGIGLRKEDKCPQKLTRTHRRSSVTANELRSRLPDTVPGEDKLRMSIMRGCHYGHMCSWIGKTVRDVDGMRGDRTYGRAPNGERSAAQAA